MMMVNGNRMGAMEIVHPKTLSYWEMRRKFDTRYTASSYTMIAGGDPCNQPTEKGHPWYIQKCDLEDYFPPLIWAACSI
jgi:hypothetical protein